MLTFGSNKRGLRKIIYLIFVLTSFKLSYRPKAAIVLYLSIDFKCILKELNNTSVKSFNVKKSGIYDHYNNVELMTKWRPWHNKDVFQKEKRTQ